MYNIHSHYETIFHALSNIVTQRRVLYLHPYGSTQPENIESISDDFHSLRKQLIEKRKTYDVIGEIEEDPLFLFYDQEPIYNEFNRTLFDYIKNNMTGPFVLVTTEKNSDALDAISQHYQWPTVYNFHHAFAAHDWFRGYRYDSRLLPLAARQIKKKYITFNRLTSHGRVYRSLLISELVKHRILDQGHVSYNDVCPENNQDYVQNLSAARDKGLISNDLFLEAVHNIAQAPMPLRIDYKDHVVIPNHSFKLSAVSESQESFCYLVTETCFWERKYHLTEKIFKPIVSRMPFVLAGSAHNLKYLREYGFKTFSPWIDESYDDIEDPVQRIQAIGNTMREICNYSKSQLEAILAEMAPVLEHNYNLFYSNEFLDYCWKELFQNIESAVIANESASRHVHEHSKEYS